MAKLVFIHQAFVREKLGDPQFEFIPGFMNSDNTLDEFLSEFVNTHLRHILQKGDVLYVGDGGYRGSFVYFWNGNAVIESSDFTGAGYRSVPKEFLVQDGDFSPNHWKKLIDYELRKNQEPVNHFQILTLGPNLKRELRMKAAGRTPMFVEVSINETKYEFFIQEEDTIESSWFWVVDNLVIQQETNWDDYATNDFEHVKQRMANVRKQNTNSRNRRNTISNNNGNKKRNQNRHSRKHARTTRRNRK
jgi:hypothetical protein